MVQPRNIAAHVACDTDLMVIPESPPFRVIDVHLTAEYVPKLRLSLVR